MQPKGVYNQDWKICIGCSNVFYASDIDPKVLKLRKFHNFKRCPECRGRTDIRNNYRRIYSTNRAVTTLDPYEKLIYEIGTRYRSHLMTMNDAQLLIDKLLDGNITIHERHVLRNHYSYILFFLKYHIKLPNIPYYEIEDIDKDLLKMIYF